MRYELMRPSEIRREIAKGTPLVWPIGVMEFHGGHLPVGTDTLTVIECCERLEKEMDVMIFPAFHFGAASKAVSAPAGAEGARGTIDVTPDAMVPFFRQTFRGLLDAGLRNIHAFVFHQSEDFIQGMPTDLSLRLAARQTIMEYLEEKRGAGWWGDASSAGYYTNHGDREANPFVWIQTHPLMDEAICAEYPIDHAGKGETSLMMAARPRAVSMAEHEARFWFSLDATEASPELGEEMIGKTVASMKRILGA